MNWIAPIQKSLSHPPKRCIYGSQGITELPGSPRRTNWIVSRRFLRHNVFEVPQTLPENKRASALLLQVRKWAPFAQTRFAVHWIGHQAAVYAWNGALMDEAIVAAGYHPARCTVWPEAFFRAPATNGARLVNAVDGVEGQAWRDGMLTTTRWWAKPPTAQDWGLFLRSASMQPNPGDTAVPSALDLPLLELPWTETAAPFANVWSSLEDQRVAASIAAAFFAPILYFLTQITVTGIAQAQVESARTALNNASQGVRNDRAAALENLNAIDAYLGLQPYPTQFEIVAKTTQLTRDKDITIAEWNYDNGNLDMTLRGAAALDASSFIEMFERDGMFTDVSATTSDQGRELRIKTHIKRSIAGLS